MKPAGAIEAKTVYKELAQIGQLARGQNRLAEKGHGAIA
jgi:hypothetical protein